MNSVSNTQIEKAMAKVLNNIKTVKYGDVSVLLKIHAGRVVTVVHSVTQTIRETNEEVVDD